ncbi:peptide chain release factor H [Pseudoalteromonas luteoviolacea]|uniref:Peptide chain release factor H n=1 Tax=Pseudoalteromonas luteoviolacea TaxID=43657 RepID=A0A1C0TPH3_9GAMM|nr:peptide chain release factor H [Pseudoalteromonas luteoviolacea]OCQ20847.1 peptide chain release factor H [Pseudoalteromonas luteoviolacea]
MILLQLSSGQGPLECCKALGLAFAQILKESKSQGIVCETLELTPAEKQACYKSVVVKLSSPDIQATKQFAQSWQGAMLWVCESQFRPNHRRKNWFFSGQMYELDEYQFDAEITFQTCRASGAGGQHVNKTDSAVRATHAKTGISVRVESERSQHANKKLARALVLQKLAEIQQTQVHAQEKSRWQQHQKVERGDPVRIFKGPKFVAKH